jgi:TPR repeat protein
MARLLLSSLLLLFALSGQPVEFNPDSLDVWEVNNIQRLFEDADYGSAEAQFQLGIAYFEGQIIEQDHDRCAWWIRRAALAGHPYAQGFLGVMYVDGVGVPQDDVEAYVWHAVAAANGEENAAESLERLARNLTPMAFLAAQVRADRLDAKIKEGIQTGKPFCSSGPTRPPVRPPSHTFQTTGRNLA